MSQLNVGRSWEYAGLKFHGLSLSGIRTSIAIPELQIAFDVAQGYPYLFPLRKFFISHGHMDHAAGIPYLISQKNLYHMPTPEFYMPPSLVEPLTQIIRLWEKIEDHTYRCDFHGVSGEDIPVKPRYFVRPFPTSHRIESFGYTLFHTTKKLAASFREAPKSKIIEARKKGQEIHEIIETPLVSFTGDTKIEFLFAKDWIISSKILMLEATYLDEKKSIEQARQWGHTHLDEIIPHLDSIKSEKIVLIHLSSRYSTEQAWEVIKRKVPAHHLDRIDIFPGR